MRYFVILLTSCLLLTACIKSRPLEVQQGNVVTRQMIDKLRPGMSKSQVSYILGDPVLQDTFNKNRWTYIYTEQIGTHKVQDYKVLVYFQGGRLSHFSGNLLPIHAKLTHLKKGVEQYTT